MLLQVSCPLFLGVDEGSISDSVDDLEELTVESWVLDVLSSQSESGEGWVWVSHIVLDSDVLVVSDLQEGN